MNKRRIQLTARFEPEIRFDVPRSQFVPVRAIEVTELDRLKQRLVEIRLAGTEDAELGLPIRHAAKEAAALAWATAFPLLVFPELFAEKALGAGWQATRQRDIRRTSERISQVLAEVA